MNFSAINFSSFLVNFIELVFLQELSKKVVSQEKIIEKKK